jgi:hypothetical protein
LVNSRVRTSRGESNVDSANKKDTANASANKRGSANSQQALERVQLIPASPNDEVRRKGQRALFFTSRKLASNPNLASNLRNTYETPTCLSNPIASSWPALLRNTPRWGLLPPHQKRQDRHQPSKPFERRTFTNKTYCDGPIRDCIDAQPKDCSHDRNQEDKTATTDFPIAIIPVL